MGPSAVQPLYGQTVSRYTYQWLLPFSLIHRKNEKDSTYSTNNFTLIPIISINFIRHATPSNGKLRFTSVDVDYYELKNKNTPEKQVPGYIWMTFLTSSTTYVMFHYYSYDRDSIRNYMYTYMNTDLRACGSLDMVRLYGKPIFRTKNSSLDISRVTSDDFIRKVLIIEEFPPRSAFLPLFCSYIF